MRQHIFVFSFLCLFYLSISAADSEEKYNSGWRFNADNDLLTGQTTDRDYTGGIAFTLSGARVQQYPVSIDSWRAGIDRLTNFQRLYQSSEHQSFHSQQFGMTLFTPDNIDTTLPVYDDRPYASLFFISNSEFTVLPKENKAYLSRLTVGFLGLDLAEDVQGFLHKITGSDVPNGWRNQISTGGEPTLMLTYAMQNNVYTSSTQQLKTEYEANLGFITDINAGISWRWGRIRSSWWSFNPYQSKYIQQSMPVFSGHGNTRGNELYFWAGGRLNLRVYNALLQGQFRKSEVTISSSDLRRLVAEYWLGGTAEFARKYYASIFLRGLSNEFYGPGSRNAVWVGLVFSHAY